MQVREEFVRRVACVVGLAPEPIAKSGVDNHGGNLDKIRIKVWNSSTNAVLYDTQPGQADLATPTTIVRNGTYSIKH